MSVKAIDGFGFQGIPKMLYADNGPFSKSRVFLNVMEDLGVQVVTHMPAGSDSRRVTARTKGKVERPFRTIPRSARNPVPLPSTANRGRSESVAPSAFGELQRPVPSS